MTDIAVALLKAEVLGDVETAKSLNSALSDDDLDHYDVLAVALFAGAISHRLGEAPEDDEIDAFVAELREDYRNAEPAVDMTVMEALVRAMFGADEMLDGVSGEEQHAAQLPIISKIVAQSNEMKTRIDDHLADAESLARQWESEERDLDEQL